MTRQPVLFLSHGSPMLAIDGSPAHRFLRGLAADLRRPDAVVVVSAHFETDDPAVGAAPEPATIHDFGGFDPALYDIRYPAAGAPALAAALRDRLDAAGLKANLDAGAGLDHGVWVPLSLIWPAADLPVVPLSVQTWRGPDHHLRLGRALAPLRDDGILVIGSGAATHNLRAYFQGPPPGVPADFALQFAEWLAEILAAARWDDLAAYRRLAPHAALNHPTEEHLLPLLVAAGAAGSPGRRLHSSWDGSVLAMDMYRFD